MPEIIIRGGSIVFLVKGNSPSMFSENFMSHHEIFPDHLKVIDSVKLPPVSQLKLSDGYKFEAVDNRIKFEVKYPEERNLDQSFAESINEIDNLAESSRKIAEAAPFLDYYAVGINFDLKILNFDLQSFLVDTLNDFSPNSIKISKRIDSYKLNLTFQSLNDKASILEANIHHDLSNVPEEGIVEIISDIVEDRAKFLSTNLEELKKIF